MAHDFYSWQGEKLLLHVLVQPKASKDEICGIHGDAIKIRITAPPVDGKANQYLIQFLSKNFKVPKSHIKLVSGSNSRYKRLSIESPQKLPNIILPKSNES